MKLKAIALASILLITPLAHADEGRVNCIGGWFTIKVDDAVAKVGQVVSPHYHFEYWADYVVKGASNEVWVEQWYNNGSAINYYKRDTYSVPLNNHILKVYDGNINGVAFSQPGTYLNIVRVKSPGRQDSKNNNYLCDITMISHTTVVP